MKHVFFGSQGKERKFEKWNRLNRKPEKKKPNESWQLLLFLLLRLMKDPQQKLLWNQRILIIVEKSEIKSLNNKQAIRWKMMIWPDLGIEEIQKAD